MLLSSHQLPEVQELCDRVAIVDRGRVVYEGALADLRRQGGAGYRLRSTDDARALRDRARPARASSTPSRAASTACSFQARGARRRRAVARARPRPAWAILALTPELATLEDLFFRLTEGDERRDGQRARRPRGDRCMSSRVSASPSLPVAAPRARAHGARRR